MPDDTSSAAFDVDLSNLQLADDEPIEGLDVDAEFNAPLRPLDDGVHTLRLSVSERKPKIQGKTAQVNGVAKTTYMLFVQGQAMEPGTPNDNKFCDDILTTRVMNDGSCSAVAFLLNSIKVEKSEVARMSKGQLIAKVFEAISGNPIVQAETQWQTPLDQTDAKGKAKRLRGQKRYPKDAQGNPLPLREDPVTGAEVYTRAQIVRYLG